MVIILGGGLAGLSAAYHLAEDHIIYEMNEYAGGHIHSQEIDGFTWDEGPHVSFTEHKYVKDLFEFNTDNEILEYPVKAGNFFNGNWIPHPAQTNLYAIPEPIRSQCLEGIVAAKDEHSLSCDPVNYKEWLERSFGNVFTSVFPSAYTRKYWTTNPENLGVSWVGSRVYNPNLEEVKLGYMSPLAEETHYVKRVRYPNKGGYISFAKKMIESSDIRYNHELEYVDFVNKELVFCNGVVAKYSKLISTIPLPILIERSNAPEEIKSAALKLSCSSVLLVNITANHVTQRPENWIYVYDEDKFSTRINCTELLSPNNAPAGKTGIQVEVYFSKYKPLTDDVRHIADSVCKELIEMKLIRDMEHVESIDTKFVKWANVIFDHEQAAAQDTILRWLEQMGLSREADDLHPLTDWKTKMEENVPMGSLILSGRFGQWKYYWTDDCVLRGLLISNSMNN